MTDPRTGRPRKRAQAEVRATEPNCWLCGTWIDQALDAQRDPMGSTVDEVVPIADGGSTTDRANLRHAHRACNTFRGDRPVDAALLASLLAYLVRKGHRRATVGTTSRAW